MEKLEFPYLMPCSLLLLKFSKETITLLTKQLETKFSVGLLAACVFVLSVVSVTVTAHLVPW